MPDPEETCFTDKLSNKSEEECASGEREHRPCCVLCAHRGGSWGAVVGGRSGAGAQDRAGGAHRKGLLCRPGSGWLSSSTSFFQSQTFDPQRHQKSHLHLCFLQVEEQGRGEERNGEGSRHGGGGAERGCAWPLEPAFQGKAHVWNPLLRLLGWGTPLPTN